VIDRVDAGMFFLAGLTTVFANLVYPVVRNASDHNYVALVLERLAQPLINFAAGTVRTPHLSVVIQFRVPCECD